MHGILLPPVVYSQWSLNLKNGRVLPIKQLFAQRGIHPEPVTYWIVVGDHVVNSRIHRKIEQPRYWLTGKVPDGALVRISSIDRDETRAYALHDAFIVTMSETLSSENLI